jgi:hypothetical protein
MPAIDGRVIDVANPSLSGRFRFVDIYCVAWLSHAITALVDFGIPDKLGDTPQTTTQLAAASNLHEPSLYRALRALAANGIFEELPNRKFAHNQMSRLLRADNPDNWRGLARMWGHPACVDSWKNFRGSLQDGRSGIQHSSGRTLYEFLHDNPEANDAFSEAMTSNSALASRALARKVPFHKYKRVVDLGGGVGALLVEILREHPHLRGVNFETPDLEQQSIEYLAAQQMSDRIEFAVGNFLESVPNDCDLYLIKNSLWNWDDDNCSAILRNVRAAMGSDKSKRFMIVEYIINEDNARWTTVYDLQILNLPGGRARTETEYREMLVAAGFDVESITYVEDQTVVIASPA